MLCNKYKIIFNFSEYSIPVKALLRIKRLDFANFSGPPERREAARPESER